MGARARRRLRGHHQRFSVPTGADATGLGAAITDILRNKEFSTKRARHKSIPWGPAQDDAFAAIISALVSPPVLMPPDWEQPFTLHTDARERAAGAVLTQVAEGRDTAIGFGSHRWSQAESRRAPTDREVRAALFDLDHFGVYLLHRTFTLVTDCSTITWLFTSQHLSSTMYRYALRMMEFSMTLSTPCRTPSPVFRRKGQRGHLATPRFRTTPPARWAAPTSRWDQS